MVALWGLIVVAATTSDALLDRIAADSAGGDPIVVTVYVALCDTGSQGVIADKHPHMCKGGTTHNLYWTTASGPKGFLGKRQHGWQRLAYEKNVTAEIAARGVWKKRVATGPELTQRGAPTHLDLVVVAIAYEGPAIAASVRDFLRAVANDDPQTVRLRGTEISYGGASHVLAFMGHDYFMDVADTSPLLSEASGNGQLHKGALALSCLSDTYFRPALAQPTTRILVLNKTLTYPSFFTIAGVLEGLVAGEDPEGIRRRAARAFATTQGKSFEEMLDHLAGP
ncbi:hypothetical protein ACFL6C_08895 [Myxococcota bacterium]